MRKDVRSRARSSVCRHWSSKGERVTAMLLGMSANLHVQETRNPASEPAARPGHDPGAGNSSLPGRDMLTYIPPEATVVAYVDVDALMNSDIYRWVENNPLTSGIVRESGGGSGTRDAA